MSLIARAAGAALLAALAAPAAAQQLPPDLAGRLIAESLWTAGSTLRFVAADRATVVRSALQSPAWCRRRSMDRSDQGPGYRAVAGIRSVV